MYLKINKISKAFNQPLLDEVTLSHTGTGVVALIGDNGSGKSTLLKILSGQEEADSGEFIWSGVDSVGTMPQEIVNDSTLSGGQKKIMVLSDLFYASHFDVLLLDEPDNHLDLDGKLWLEEAIKSYSGLIIMISHDRTLLENVSTHTWLVEDNEVRTYPFGYKKFRQVYEEEQESLAKLHKLQSAEQKRLSDMALMFRDKGQIGAYRNTQKRLERLEADMVKDPHQRKASITLQSKLDQKIIKRKTAILVKDLSFSYENFKVFQKANLHLFVQDKVALLSPNGTGKTTLIKLLLGTLTPTSGAAKIGDNLNIGYYSQEHSEKLDPEETPMSCFTRRYPLFDYQVEGILRKFFFSKQNIKSKIRTLSGGQKSRLQLALFLYQNPDLLILDEPTNHLDLKSIAALEEFLINFPGTILLVSHDRELVSKVCSEIYLIKDHQLIPHELNIG